MKKWTLTKILASLSLMTTSMPILAITTACSNEHIDVKTIKLIPSQEWATPGSKVTFSAITEPQILSPTDLDWKITKNPFYGIEISESGVVTVPDNLLVSSSNTLVVTAYSKVSPEIKAEATIFIVPIHSDELAGFEDNRINYVNLDNSIANVGIMLKSPKTYITTEPINIWDGAILQKPQDWDSIIKFVPVIRDGAVKMMSFTRAKETTWIKSAIAWDDGYTDGSFVPSIPLFHGTNHKCIQDSLIVRFACDPEASLTINFNIWKQTSEESTVELDYVPEHAEDKHEIIEVGPNKFLAKCYCPASSASEETHIGMFDKIYCHREKYEYLNFNFDVEIVADERIRSRLDVDYSYIKEIRPYDNLSSYVMELQYKFDLIGIQAIPELDGSELFILSATDPLMPDKTAFSCTFILEWE